MATPVPDALKQKCHPKYEEWQSCVSKGKKHCEKAQVKYLGCIAEKQCPTNIKEYMTCHGSIMGAGGYKNQKNCNPQLEVLMSWNNDPEVPCVTIH